MSELDKALDLCNKNKFDDALPILEEITKNDPQNSEAWRTLAQIHWFHLHQPDKAYDELIEALRCEPTNLWALILMGNLLTKEKNDIDEILVPAGGGVKIQARQDSEDTDNEHRAAPGEAVAHKVKGQGGDDQPEAAQHHHQGKDLFCGALRTHNMAPFLKGSGQQRQKACCCPRRGKGVSDQPA